MAGMQQGLDDAPGFTLIELVVIILLLSILAVAVVAKWPSGMETEAAALEFKRAVRQAQHMAMTREFIAANPWGLIVDTATSRYTIQRRDGSENVADSNNRLLLDNGAMTIAGGPASPATGLWFNGLGEPVDDTGAPLPMVTYLVAGTETMVICPQTGYVVRGATCP